MGVGAFGALALAVGTLLGPQETMAGAVVFVVAAIVAMRELATPTLTWPNAIGAFVLVMWLIPARGYRLPITLPFNLEPYRIVLGVLIIALIAQVFRGDGKLEFRSGQELWDWVLNGNPIAGMLVADLTDGQRADVRAMLDGMLRERSGGSGAAVLTNPVHIGIGTK